MTTDRMVTVEPRTPGRLDALLALTRRDVERRAVEVPPAVLERRAARVQPNGRAFVAAVSRRDRVNVIAECKRRSPSRGALRADLDPVELSVAYERNGASAVSVLTEPHAFGGSLADLEAIRRAVGLPLLRKDFVLTEYQLLEARAAGADAVLLIAAALDRASLAGLFDCASALGLGALVEVHDEGELAEALGLGVALVGINCRNLRTFDVDISTAERLAGGIPPSVTAVAESGITSPAQIARLTGLGYRAFLVGEALVTSADPGATLAGWLEELRRCG